jgi:hypothetical protein
MVAGARRTHRRLLDHASHTSGPMLRAVCPPLRQSSACRRPQPAARAFLDIVTRQIVARGTLGFDIRF